MAFIESHIQRACVSWFRMQYPRLAHLLFAVPNGSRRDAVTGAVLKAEGVVAGVSDLILLYPSAVHHGLCIEMKTPSRSSRQSEHQKEWEALVTSAGYKYVVCRSLDSFMAEVRTYFSEV